MGVVTRTSVPAVVVEVGRCEIGVVLVVVVLVTVPVVGDSGGDSCCDSDAVVVTVVEGEEEKAAAITTTTLLIGPAFKRDSQFQVEKLSRNKNGQIDEKRQ